MTRVPINNVGSIGIIRDTDQPEHALAVNAWSSGQNVRFQDNKVIKMTGHQAVFDPPTVAPEWALALPTSTQFFWLYASLTAVYAYQGGTHTDITRGSGAYSATAAKSWNGGLLGGIPVINNGIDPPQYWSAIDVGGNLADLSNWQANVTAAVIKPFGNFLVALNIEKNSGTNKFPHMIKWSHPADPGAVPSSWDETAATKDTGEQDLTDVSAGIIRDGLALGDIFVVYKDGSTWGMQFIGGTFIFRIFKIFETSGILTSNCVAALPPGNQKYKGHFVATGDDLIVHNGQQAQSIVDRKWRRYLSNNIDTDNFDRAFCVTNFAEKEMWFCYPETGATLPNVALTWSLVDGSIGIRDLNNISYIAQGPIEATEPKATWNTDTETWADDVTVWGDQLFTPFVRRLLGCNPVGTKLYQFDTNNTLDGTPMISNVTRTGLTISGIDRSGNPISDFGQNRKLLSRIWPRMTGGPVNIRLGAQETSQDTVIWSTAASFTPGTDEFLDPDTPPSGRFLAVEIESQTDVAWELEGYDLDIDLLGKH